MRKETGKGKGWTYREKNRVRCFVCFGERPEPIRCGAHLSCKVERQMTKGEGR